MVPNHAVIHAACIPYSLFGTVVECFKLQCSSKMCIVAAEDLSCIAVGLQSGAVKLFRGNILKERKVSQLFQILGLWQHVRLLSGRAAGAAECWPILCDRDWVSYVP